MGERKCTNQIGGHGMGTCGPGWLCAVCSAEKPLLERIAELESKLRAYRTGEMLARFDERGGVEIDLSPAGNETAIRAKLIELGWTPPEDSDGKSA